MKDIHFYNNRKSVKNFRFNFNEFTAKYITFKYTNENILIISIIFQATSIF